MGDGDLHQSQTSWALETAWKHADLGIKKSSLVLYYTHEWQCVYSAWPSPA